MIKKLSAPRAKVRIYYVIVYTLTRTLKGWTKDVYPFSREDEQEEAFKRLYNELVAKLNNNEILDFTIEGTEKEVCKNDLSL